MDKPKMMIEVGAFEAPINKIRLSFLDVNYSSMDHIYFNGVLIITYILRRYAGYI
jgi:hypothetical protein